MGRVGDDAHQSCRVEQAFLLIEIPAAVLLRHQPALQAVGQLGHRRLQRDELLVEIGAQTGQFLVVAQVGSAHHFVELGGVGGIFEVRRQIRQRQVGPPGHHALVAILAHLGVGHHVGIHFHFAALGIFGRFG